MPIAVDAQGNALFLDQDGQWKPAQKAVNPQTGESLAFDGAQWTPIGGAFAERAASMDPTAISVARSKNDPFGDYLRQQAMAPRTDETDEQRSARLYGSLPQEAAPGRLEGMARGYLQGGTFGGGDELVAAGAAVVDPLLNGSGGSIGERYDAYLNRERQRLSRFRESNPYLAYGSEIAGAIPTAAMVPGFSGVKAAQGAGLTARMGAGAVTGAIQGGVYGFNAGEDGLKDRAGNAAWGAGVGGAVGLVTPAVIDGVSKTLRYLADQTVGRMGGANQATAAARKAAEALVRDGLTPEEAAQRIAQLGPEGALMDVGPNTRAIAASTARAPGAGKTMLDEFVTVRQEGTRGANNVLEGGQINRITDALDTLVPDKYTLAERGALETARSNAARPAYQVAVDNAANLVPEDQFAAVVRDPFIAQELAKVKASKLYGMSDLPGNSMPVIDAAKKSIDDQVTAAYRSGNNNAARLLKQKADMLRSVADDAFPGYAHAREIWRDYSNVIDAGDLGRKFMSGDVDVVKQAILQMSPDEAAQFRTGAAQALRDKIGGLVSRADATKKLKDIPALEQKVRLAFGDDKTFARYIGMLNAERSMFDTYTAIKGGSQTAERLAADMDAAVDPGRAADAVVRMAQNPLSPSNIVNMVRTLSGNTAARASTPEPVRRELAKILLSQDPSILEAQLQARMASEEGRRSLSRLLTTTGAVSGAR